MLRLQKNIEELKAQSDLDSDSTISPTISPAESPFISDNDGSDHDGSDHDNDEPVLDEVRAAQKIQTAWRQKAARDPNETDSSMAQEGVLEEQKGPQFSLKWKGSSQEAIQVSDTVNGVPQIININVNLIQQLVDIKLEGEDEVSLKDFLIKSAYKAKSQSVNLLSDQKQKKVYQALVNVWYNLPGSYQRRNQRKLCYSIR